MEFDLAELPSVRVSFGVVSVTSKFMQAEEKTVKHLFIDEAGDLTLFNKRGKIIVGTEGVSNLFMIGLINLPNPKFAHEKLEELRENLLRDSYFRNVPSFQPVRKKTAICFHAKDDLPEVRREVFRLLPSFGAKVSIAIRRKQVLAEEAKALFAEKGEKLKPNRIYDELVSRVLRDQLHQADENRIVFARRGTSLREVALEDSIIHAKRAFAERWGAHHDKPCLIDSGYPSEFGGLQIVDYYLWAVQRLFERGEDRFFYSVASDYDLIIDLNDKRSREKGEVYSEKHPLELQKIKPVAS